MSNVSVLGKYGWISLDSVIPNNTVVFSIKEDENTGYLRGSPDKVSKFRLSKNFPVMEGYSYDRSTDTGYSNRIFFTEKHHLLTSYTDNDSFGENTGKFILDNFGKMDIFVKNMVYLNNRFPVDTSDLMIVERFMKNRRLTPELVFSENSNIPRLIVRNIANAEGGIIHCTDYNTLLLYEAIAVCGGYSIYRIPNTMNFKILTNPSTRIGIIKANNIVKIEKIPVNENGNQLHLIYNYDGNVWIL